MKIDKDDLFIGAIGIGLILCSPFTLTFSAGKWIYRHTPWELKKKKELDKEIHLLEEKLGLYGRNDKSLHYDPLYFRNNFLRNREDYCKDLKKKLEKGYVSPPIIIATTRESFPTNCCISLNTIYDVVLLVHKDYYHIPKESERADTYFEQGKSNAHEKDPLPKPQHRYIHAETRAECGHYENYYTVEVPGWYEYHEIQSSRVIREFIENFKNKYKKE